MLEHLALRIGSFQIGPKGRFRTVHDAVTLELIGHVIRRRRFGCLTSRADMVYEEPDGSLLTSIRQTWWLAVPTVLDADNGAIAMIYRRLLEWPDERVMAEIVKTGRHKGEFHAAVGVELANYAKQSDGILLTFHPRISSEPFIKMAILGAVLTRC